MRDTQDCIDFCAKKGIQPDTELVRLKLDGRDVVNVGSQWSRLMFVWVHDDANGHEVGFWNLKVTADQIEAVYDKLREKNDRITRYVLDITNSDWNVFDWIKSFHN